MARNLPVTIGHEIQDELVKSGIVPRNCTRVVIDIPVNDLVKVYYEVYGDERLLDVNWGKIAKTIKKGKA